MRRRHWALHAGPAGIPVLLGLFLVVSTRLAQEPAAPKAVPSRFAALVSEVRRGVLTTTPKALQARRDSGARFYLIDVREDREWDAGHLPGAIHLSKGVLERDIETAVPDAGAEIVLYCGTGGRSVLAADNLRRMGYTKVYSLDGGAAAWFAEGQPVAQNR